MPFLCRTLRPLGALNGTRVGSPCSRNDVLGFTSVRIDSQSGFNSRKHLTRLLGGGVKSYGSLSLFGRESLKCLLICGFMN